MSAFFLIIFTLGILFSIVAGLIGLVAPSVWRVGKMEKNPSRRRIAGISLAAFVFCFAGGLIATPKPTPAEIAAQAAADKKAEVERLAKAELASKAALAQKKAKADREAKEVRATLAATITTIRRVDKVCTDAITQIGKVAKGGGDQYALYNVVRDAAESCGQAHAEMATTSVPEKVTKAHNLCVQGEMSRALALARSASVIDSGYGSPSTLHSLTEEIETGHAQILTCMSILAMAAESSGLKFENLK